MLHRGAASAATSPDPSTCMARFATCWKHGQGEMLSRCSAGCPSQLYISMQIEPFVSLSLLMVTSAFCTTVLGGRRHRLYEMDECDMALQAAQTERSQVYTSVIRIHSACRQRSKRWREPNAMRTTTQQQMLTSMNHWCWKRRRQGPEECPSTCQAVSLPYRPPYRTLENHRLTPDTLKGYSMLKRPASDRIQRQLQSTYWQLILVRILHGAAEKEHEDMMCFQGGHPQPGPRQLCRCRRSLLHPPCFGLPRNRGPSAKMAALTTLVPSWTLREPS